ncbi:metallophosphoesterase [Cyanobium sp. FGCU-52]|nr:metallophosphoesterase [Cyanobium sp. FGCU52]
MALRRRQLLQLAAAGLGGAGWLLAERLAPAAALPGSGDLRLGLISDFNSSYGSTTYMPTVSQGLRQLLARRPALIACAGDMVAGQKPGLGAARLDAMWDAFGRTVLMPVRQAGVPFLPAVGNHDGSPGFTADREAVRRFWLPRRQALGLNFVDSGLFPFHYSVLQNEVFWLVWDASSSRIPPEQLAWARRQLASPAARQARLRLVMGHLPLFGISQGRDRPGEVLDQAAAVQDLLEAGGVQAYISGHQHAWFPARRDQLDLIQLGALGSGPRRLVQGSIPPQQTTTTLDIDWPNGSLVETTFAVSTGQEVAWS